LFFNFASEHTIYDSYVFNKLTSLAYTRTWCALPVPVHLHRWRWRQYVPR
jgi:hypothetical protein